MTSKIAKRIRALRETQGLTQAELALYVGISRATLIAIEQGKRMPKIVTLTKICRRLGISDLRV